MLDTPIAPDVDPKASTNKAFYVQLGQRMAAGQVASPASVQLAETLGIAQQTLARYEAGKPRRLSSSRSSA